MLMRMRLLIIRNLLLYDVELMPVTVLRMRYSSDVSRLHMPVQALDTTTQGAGVTTDGVSVVGYAMSDGMGQFASMGTLCCKVRGTLLVERSIHIQ